MGLTSSYNSFTFRLSIVLDGKCFVYKDVSPFQNEKFRKKSKNVGKAMAYIRTFQLIEPCPVCGREHLDEKETCCICGWEHDKVAETPDMCSGGPNYAPLETIKRRWERGERDLKALSVCPYGGRCLECPHYTQAKPQADQETG